MPECSSSEHLGFVLQQTDKFRHRGGALADDPARLTLGWEFHFRDRQVLLAQLCRFSGDDAMLTVTQLSALDLTST